MSRWKAAAIHFLISATVAALLLAVIYFVLYPPPLFRAMGGSSLALLVIAVDVVLGPLLTLAVFKHGKKSLKFDLSVIAGLQLMALAYGLHVVWIARPAFIVARDDIAYVVSAGEISAEDLAQGKDEQFRSFPLTGPIVARLKRPEEGAEQQRVLKLNLDTGKDIQRMPEFYRAWDAVPATDLLAKAEPLADLRHRKPQAAAAIDAWLAKHGREADSVRYLTVLTLHEELCLAVDSVTGAYLGIIDAEPS